MDISYILNELGEEREKYFNAVSPPIMQTSNFCFNTVSEFREALTNEYEHTVYSRGGNPTVDILRQKLAALDGAEDALVFSSGVAATAIPILALLQQGDHVICVQNPYSWTVKLFRNMMPRFGVSCTFIDGTNIKNFEEAIQDNTRMIYLESPNTFSYELQDIAAVATLAKPRGIITMIDNSYCGPLYQRPIELGIDLVMQTATKYIGGHSDVVAGVISGRRNVLKKIFEHEFMTIGASISPHSAWLLIRGLRTMPLRINQSFESAKVIINWLQNHPKIDRVIWPLNSDFKQIELAKKQMTGCGGLFSFTLKNSSAQNIEAFCNKLQHILMAVSWGGHESLIIPAIAGIPAADYDITNPRHQLMRMYVGLEEPEYLIKDLENALMHTN